LIDGDNKPTEIPSIDDFSFGSEPFPAVKNYQRWRGWWTSKGASTMATQIVMDHTGDSRHDFDPADAKALAKAEQRFKELTGAGFTAAVRTATGDPAITRRFDPAAEETLFFPRLVGG
jgi:hypothetical protein